MLDVQTLRSNWEAVETNGNKRNGGSFVGSACGVQRHSLLRQASEQPRAGAAPSEVGFGEDGGPAKAVTLSLRHTWFKDFPSCGIFK